MLVTILDDSPHPYDGNTPAHEPLGAPEKSVIGLAAALTARGHTVRVYNAVPMATAVDGVSWQPLEDCRAAQSDWIIAHRTPALLKMIPDAKRRALLLSAPGDTLGRIEAYAPLNQYRATLLVQGVAHSYSVPSALQSLNAAVLPMGVGPAFLDADEMAPGDPLHAIATAHPARGLDWLLGLWCESVHPRLPWAELHVYSAVLDKGARGAVIPDSLRPVLDQARAASAQGVRIKAPLPDPGMVGAYRQARALLYPGSDRDVLCGTLAESQAVGLPAVARPRGAADERLRNGLTGFLAPDDEAFANLAVRLLDDTQTFQRMSDAARSQQRGQTWDRAAAELERVLV